MMKQMYTILTVLAICQAGLYARPTQPHPTPPESVSRIAAESPNRAASESTTPIAGENAAAWQTGAPPPGGYQISDFEELPLERESYWNGSGGSGSFVSGLARFPNDYDAQYQSWSRWAYSNISDTVTTGYSNQYSAVTGAGVDTLASGGSTYGVGFVPISFTTFEPQPVPLRFTDSVAHEVAGLYVTNTTYTANTLENGDDFTDAFGGPDGTTPDWFMLSIWGVRDGVQTDTVDFYLADYRFEEPADDYIVDSWQWVGLTELGLVDSLMFTLSSSDVGDWGINTPLYFSVDHMYIRPDSAPVVLQPLENIALVENGADTVISLEGVFTDPDNDDHAIAKRLHSNSNASLVTATIDGNDLTLSPAADATGEAEIVIRAESNSKTVTDTFTVAVNPVTAGWSEETTAVTVYPNPSPGAFRVRVPGTNTPVELTICTLNGAVVYRDESYSSNGTIRLSDRRAGTYVIKIQSSEWVLTRLLIIH